MSNDDEINEFSPAKDGEDSVKEYNPYSNFLDDDKNENIPDSDSFQKNKEEYVTTEEDIQLPDFLRPATDVSDFQKAVRENPSVEVHGDEQKTYDAEAEHDNVHNADAENFAQRQNPYSTESDDVLQAQSNAPEIQTGEETVDGKKSFKADTLDEEEDKRFVPKVSASEADRHPGGKPRVLNKKFLLTVIIVVVGGIFLITFLMPTGKKKKSKNEKPVAETHLSKDYESIAARHPVSDECDAGEAGHYDNADGDKNEETEIPPVITATDKKPYEPQYVNKNTGNGTGGTGPASVEIPDTRNDSLQGKRISGIKGLSSTQESYSTDYQQTIAKNTAETSSSPSHSLPSKNEYMNNVLSAYSQAYGNASGNNSYAMQNDQSGKNSFFNNGRSGNNVGQSEWLNLNTLWQGSIFEAVLTSELNTDLPGEITARIAKNIYSSQDGRYLLIPQNSVLYGTYNSSISYSQSRVQVAWNTLIRPDGYQIQLGNMNGTDAKGASGLKGFVNDHPMAYLKAIGLMSVFSIANREFSSSMGETKNPYVQNVIANTQQVANELSDKLIDRAMNVQPTIKIKAGTKINIVVNQNLSLPPVENIEVTQPYHRQR